MSVDESLRAADLAGAVQKQVQEVKARPTDHGARTRLVQLLVFAGEYDRAESHLLTLAQQDQSLQMATALYGNLLAAEEERRRAFAGECAPNLPPDPPAWIHDQVALLRARAAGQHQQAKTLLARVRAEPSQAGVVDGDSFTMLADFDDFIGPVLEVFAGGRYLWVPFARLRRLTIAAPKGPLDLLWTCVEIEERGGTSARVHVPVLYQGSAQHGDDLVRIGRKTEWEDVAELGFRGYGQRLLLADGNVERPWLAIRSVEFHGDAASGDAASGGAA